MSLRWITRLRDLFDWFNLRLLIFLLISISSCIPVKTSGSSSKILSAVSPYLDYHTNPGWDLIEPKLNPKYTHHDAVVDKLKKVHSAYPEITKLYSIGQSVEGRELWVISIGDNPTVHEPGEPEVKLVANIHGNEALGRELLLNFVELLCANYGRDDRISLLLQHTQIHILPSMNPDGFEMSNEDTDSNRGRENMHGIDLNRNFPDQFVNSSANRVQEPETLAVIHWTLGLPFVLSASLHAGALVAVYPYDGSRDHRAHYSASPDDAVFRYLALTYSMAHRQMRTGLASCAGDSFPMGIANGNSWYPLYGGMQDWNYLHSGCMELTIELGCAKYPRAATIATYWTDNKFALLVFVAQVHRALRGFVLDARTGAPIGNAAITVQNNSHLVWSTEKLGEYWRLLPPSGMFTVWASRPGYFNSTPITINATELPFVRQSGREQWNFTLWPDQTASWSLATDFDIALNRLPSYTFVPSVYKAVLSASSDVDASPFVTVLDLGEDSRRLIGVQIAVVGKALRPRSHTDSIVWKAPGRVRIVLMTGVLGQDATSVEMGLRLLRHLVSAVQRPFVGVTDYLLSTQIVLIPYLDEDAIDEAAKLTDYSDATQTDACDASGQDNLTRFSESGTRLPAAIRQFLQAYEPHVLLTLETAGNWPNHDWPRLGDRQVSLPVKPIFLPSLNQSAGILMSRLAMALAMNYDAAAGTALYGKHCPSGGDAASSALHHDLGELLSRAAEKSSMDQYHHLPPIGLAIRLSCPRCSRRMLPSQLLPELWHSTLSGLSSLLSTVHNLTFRGRLLVEHDPDLPLSTADPPSKLSHHLSGTDWTPSPDALVALQSAAFFLPAEEDPRTQHRSDPRWLRVPVDPHTGLFAVVLPPGAYLVHASAGPSESPLASQYEELTTAISLRSDQPHGRVHLGLERQLSAIAYHGVDDMTKRLHKLDDGPTGAKCGQLRSIGQSRSGRPIQVFELGLGVTPLRPNVSFPFADELNNPDHAPNTNTNTTTPDYLTSSLSRVLLFGNLYGHDLLTPQLLTHFVEWLCENRDRNSLAHQTLATVRLAVLPVPNPDGVSVAFDRVLSTSDSPSADRFETHGHGEYCFDTFEERQPGDRTRGGMLNDASADLWKELITLTEQYPNGTAHWWWERALHRDNFSASIEPELSSLIPWLRDYEPTAVISFPSASGTKISYGVDPSETDFAKHVSTEVHDWLQFLAHLLSPAFHDPPPPMCLSPRPRPPHRFTSATRSAISPRNFTEISALALALASVSPRHAESGADLLSSASFRPPLPLRGPISLGVSLCPACFSPNPNGLALIWKSFRLPSLILGLIGHATLSVVGSSGLIGEVQSTTGTPVPLARVHIGHTRSELLTNASRDHGRFRLALPPGRFRVSIRAPGFVDHTELIHIDPIRGPEYHVFRLTPLGRGLLGQWYSQPILIAGFLCAVLSCFITFWIVYRHGCRPRVSYAVARRLTALQKHDASPIPDAAYRLLPIDRDADGQEISDTLAHRAGPTSRLPKIGVKKKRPQANNRYVPLPQEDYDEFDDVDLA